MVKKLLMLISLITVVSMQVFAQSVRGKVTSSTDRDALPGVTVSVKGASGATMTDVNGNYTINAPSAGTLIFSSIGYKTLEVSVANRTVVDVIMDEDNTALEEVVVTALGIEREKKSLGYAVQELKGTDVVEAREVNLANAFSGKVAGLQVVRGSTGAGGTSKIFLRGQTSLTGNNQPLVIIDGVPMDNFVGTLDGDYWSAGFDYGNGLNDINPEDIQSISVLKGPSAAALYGSRAGNGVILITTKSGRKQDGLGITFTTSLGVENTFMRPDMQNTFAQGNNNIFDAMSNNSYGPKIAGQTVTKWDGTSSQLAAYDNVTQFLRQGTNQNYGLAFQQQYGATGVYSSFNYIQDNSIIPGNKLQRLNMTTKATSSFGPENRWTTDFKVSFNNTNGYNRPINGRDRSNLYSLYTMPKSLNIEDFKAGVDGDGKMIWYPGAYAWVPNPYWSIDHDINQDGRNRFMMNGSVKYAFTDWLDAEVRAGSDMYFTDKTRKTYSGGSLSNNYTFSKESFNEINYTALLRGVKDEVIGKLGGNFTLGGNLMETKSTSTWTSATLLVPDLFSIGNSDGTPGISTGLYHKKINSLFGSVGANYDGWLFLDVTGRNDWSSALSKENRSFFYPSYSLSYVLSDQLEKAGSSLPTWWDFAKLRASYATVGNDLGAYMLLNGYSIGNDQVGTTTASRDNLLKDPNVKSELIKNLEFGAELRFVDNRLGLDFTWYKSNATRQLISLPMDPMSGFASRLINAGNIQNKGFEIMLSADILRNPSGLNWNLVSNFSRNENKIIDIASDEGVNSYNLGSFDDLFIRATTGGLYGDIYGTRLLRVKDQASPFFGLPILNGEGYPQRDPEVVKLGNQQAKGLLGITNNFNYQNWGLSFLVDARLGGDMFSASTVGLVRHGVAAMTAPNGERPDMVVDGVISTEEGGFVKNTQSITQEQYWSTIGTLNNLGVGEIFLYDASNVRLRNVSLSYIVPRAKLGNTFQNVKAGISANNVWMIKSHMNGIDPESAYTGTLNAVGFESGAFPTMRSFLLSLSFGF